MLKMFIIPITRGFLDEFFYAFVLYSSCKLRFGKPQNVLGWESEYAKYYKK